LTNADERRKRVHSTILEFGQTQQLIDTSGGTEKPQQDVDALIKTMGVENEKVLPPSLSLFIRFIHN